MAKKKKIITTTSNESYIKKERSVNKQMREKVKGLWKIASLYLNDVFEERPIAGNTEDIGNPYAYFREEEDPGFGTKLRINDSVGGTGIKMIVEIKIQILKKGRKQNG